MYIIYPRYNVSAAPYRIHLLIDQLKIVSFMSLVPSGEESSCSLTTLSIPQIMNQLNNSISSYVSPRPSNIDLVDSASDFEEWRKNGSNRIENVFFLRQLRVGTDYPCTQQWKEESNGMHRLVTISMSTYTEL